MVSLFVLFHRIIVKTTYLTTSWVSYFAFRYLLLVNRVNYGKNFLSNGIPTIRVSRKGANFIIGDNFRINNGNKYNQIGRQQPCYFIVLDNAVLKIGNNVGMSATAIVCSTKIVIDDNVKIGGNVVIYDTDFHSLDYRERTKTNEDRSLIKTSPVAIGKNVFIGAHSIILKGVTIGDNSVIGAGSVISKNIPKNQIWAGNPAVFIKNID